MHFKGGGGGGGGGEIEFPEVGDVMAVPFCKSFPSCRKCSFSYGK